MAPSGKVRIEADTYDAVSAYGTFIEAGTTVRVIRYENCQLYVTPEQD